MCLDVIEVADPIEQSLPRGPLVVFEAGPAMDDIVRDHGLASFQPVPKREDVGLRKQPIERLSRGLCVWAVPPTHIA
jgi:hypothetical protein